MFVNNFDHDLMNKSVGTFVQRKRKIVEKKIMSHVRLIVS